MTRYAEWRCRAIPEGDPRYNLVQDLIEGDGRLQDWAMGMLERTRDMSIDEAESFLAQHPYQAETTG